MYFVMLIIRYVLGMGPAWDQLRPVTVRRVDSTGRPPEVAYRALLAT